MKVVLVAVVTLVQWSDGEGGRGGKPGEFHANREGRVPEFQTRLTDKIFLQLCFIFCLFSH